jgi:hypothetical protein
MKTKKEFRVYNQKGRVTNSNLTVCVYQPARMRRVLIETIKIRSFTQVPSTNCRNILALVVSLILALH